MPQDFTTWASARWALAETVTLLNNSIEVTINCVRNQLEAPCCLPTGIIQAMELQAEAERRKRASILESEGQRQAVINVAEGEKQQVRLLQHSAEACSSVWRAATGCVAASCAARALKALS